MKYLTGEEVMIGDRIRIDGEEGVVLCVIDTNQFTIEDPKEQWGYLGKGLMAKADCFGLIHYPVPDEDLVFVERKA